MLKNAVQFVMKSKFLKWKKWIVNDTSGKVQPEASEVTDQFVLQLLGNKVTIDKHNSSDVNQAIRVFNQYMKKENQLRDQVEKRKETKKMQNTLQ